MIEWNIFTCESVDVNQHGRLIINGYYVFPEVVISQPDYGWETALVILAKPGNEEENEELKNKEVEVIISNITTDGESESYAMKFKKVLPDCDGPKMHCIDFYGKARVIRLNTGRVKFEVRLDGNIIKELDYKVSMGEAPEFRESQQEFSGKIMGKEMGTIDVADLVSRATKSITLVDPYLGPQQLRSFLGGIEDNNIEVKVLTQNNQTEYRREITSLKSTYPNLTVKISSQIHDRFVLVNDDVYAFGYSLKDLQRKYSYASKIISYQTHSEIKNVIQNVWGHSDTSTI
ncbi:hypothetical protein [Priestia aryabhattai]|uniref:hypothetical protein n=1 Tax=Priestia aryabhattai TaxID=412384 RepID=UPI0030CE9146